MSTTRIHMCLDIAGALRNGNLGYFQHDDGRRMTDREAKDRLKLLQAKGWRVFPLGDCDNFDPQTGCKGHPCEEGQ